MFCQNIYGEGGRIIKKKKKKIFTGIYYAPKYGPEEIHVKIED